MARQNLAFYAVTVFAYSLLLPSGLWLTFAGSVLPPYRIVLIAALPALLFHAKENRFQPHPLDGVLFFGSIWIFASLSAVEGFTRALNGGGSQFVDIYLSYLYARVFITNLTDARRLLIVISPGLLVAGLLIFVESVSHTYIVDPISNQLVGRSSRVAEELRYYTRMGLMRAPGPFPHPILAGVFLSSFLTLFLTSSIKSWPKVIGILAGFLSFFTVSSAPVLGIILSFGLIIVDIVVRVVEKLTWRLIVACILVIILVLEVVSGSGVIGLIIRFATFDQQTAFYRLLIWEYAGASVRANPIFGIGFGEWVRPSWMSSSIDAYWLLLSVQYGIVPAFAFLSVAVGSIFALVGRVNRTKSAVDRYFLKGFIFLIFILCLQAFTVAYWLSMQSWFFFILGMAISICQAPRPSGKRPAREASRTRAGSLYRINRHG